MKMRLFYNTRANHLISLQQPSIHAPRQSFSMSTRLNYHRYRLLLRLTLFSACSFSLGLVWVYREMQKKKDMAKVSLENASATFQPILPLREKENALGSILDDLKKRRTWAGQLERYTEHLKLFADQYYHMPGCLLSVNSNDVASSSDSLKNWFADTLLEKMPLKADEEKLNWQQFVQQYQAYVALQSKESFSWTPPMRLFSTLISSRWDRIVLQSMTWTQIWPFSQLLSSRHQESKDLVAWFHTTVAPAAKSVDAPHVFSLSILEPPPSRNSFPNAQPGSMAPSRLGLIFQCLKEVWNDSLHWPLTCYPTLPLLLDSRFSDMEFIAHFASMYGLDAPVLGENVYSLFNHLYLQGAELYQVHWIANEWKTQPLLFLHDTKEKKWTSSPLRFVLYWQASKAANDQDTERRWLWLSRMNGLVDAILSAELGQVWIVNVDNDTQFSKDWHTLYSKSIKEPCIAHERNHWALLGT